MNLYQSVKRQIKSIDVGVGIPTDYHSDEEKVNYSEYATLLKVF